MPLPTETIEVAETLTHLRLDTFLRTRFPEVSRGTFQRLIESGHVLIDGKPIKATRAPRAGETITITWPAPKDPTALPEKIPLKILFEDKHLLVLNKPPGIVVHPSAGHEEHTLVNALLHHCAGELSGIGGVARPGIVHRLDRDTSGCLVVAKTDAAHLKLAEQFAGRTLEKIYHALLVGVLPRDAGDIREPIARHPSHRKRMSVSEPGEGRDAWTSYEVQERFPSSTLVEVTIHTGRTHQIRVHFNHLGFPVLGDETYGAKRNQRFAERTNLVAPRQMLHASRITFTHPKTGKKVKCEAPLPKDFKAVMKELKLLKPHVT